MNGTEDRNDAFGSTLRRYRLAARLTQEELADRSGLSVRTITNMESGRTARPRQHSVLQLAAALTLTQPATDQLQLAARGVQPVPPSSYQAQTAMSAAAQACLSGGDSADDGERDLRSQLAAAAAPIGVRDSLPPDTAAFAGRERELEMIAAAVTGPAGTSGAGGGAVVAIRAVEGMPGAGKTALAVHAAHLLAGSFPDRRLFIDLHGHTPGRDPVNAGEALAVLLAAIGEEPRRLPEDTEARAALWRDRMAGQRSLLVLDNAAGSAQVAPLLPGSGTCLVLVTSRRRLADLPGAAISVPVEVLPPDQAARMFTRLAPGAASWDFAQIAELVQLAGYLPLAISLLARVCAWHPAWGADDLIGETRARLLTLSAGHASIAAAFDVSWAHLNPRQQLLFACLSLHPGATTDGYVAAALAEVPLQDAARLLDELHGEGLVTETGYRRYGMHDLIRRYAVNRAATLMSAADRERRVGRLLDYYQHAAALAEARLALPPSSALIMQASELPFAVPEFSGSEDALAWAWAERTSLLACLDHVTRSGQLARMVALTAGVTSLLRHGRPLDTAVVVRYLRSDLLAGWY